MPETIFAAFSLMRLNEWEFLQIFLPFCVIFALFFICTVFLGNDFVDLATIHPLIFFFCSTLPMFTSGGKKKPSPCGTTNHRKTKKEETPVVSESAKKKPVKEKRKRKKSAEKENKDSIKIDHHRSMAQTKIYSTLRLYEEVKRKHCLEDSDLYFEFNRYLMTAELLAKNDFPLECPENPGRVISRCKKFRLDPTSRTCSRCHAIFHIDEDKYISDSLCLYHTSRCDLGYFSCCSQYATKGCRTAKYHVSSELSLDELVFKKVEGKRQIREDQSRKVYALDCEMVFTTIGMEVAYVGLVDLEGKPIYQTFVLPEHPVLDYNTEFSGITKSDLEKSKITLADVQSFLLKTLNKDTILIGHALQNDLRVLRLIHEKVVDTQVVFRQDNYRRKLKALAFEYLGTIIQDSKAGHDSIEDARTCMELMLWKIKSDKDLIKNQFYGMDKVDFSNSTVSIPSKYPREWSHSHVCYCKGNKEVCAFVCAVLRSVH